MGILEWTMAGVFTPWKSANTTTPNGLLNMYWHPHYSYELGNEVDKVQVGLAFRGGNQGANHTGVREELEESSQTPSKVNWSNFGRVIVM